MADTKQVRSTTDHPDTVDRARDYWSRNNKIITTIAVVVILLGGGWLAYKKLYKEPQEAKAAEAIFKAEEYYRFDSLRKALDGDGINPGFLRIIDRYGGTKAANLAHFYTGSIYLQLGDAKKAADHLEDFDTDAPQVQARAYKLLGDAYAEQGKNKEALNMYRKAASHFEEDKNNASDYLFMAAYFAQRVMKDNDEAIDLYKELKEKYPDTERGFQADKYLAQLGVYE